MLELLSPMTQQMTHMAENEDVRDSREMSRRALAEKTKIFVKIFFNGKEVCHTSAKSVGPDFAIAFGQIFPIQIVQWPESLKLQASSLAQLRHGEGVHLGSRVLLLKVIQRQEKICSVFVSTKIL